MSGLFYPLRREVNSRTLQFLWGIAWCTYHVCTMYIPCICHVHAICIPHMHVIIIINWSSLSSIYQNYHYFKLSILSLFYPYYHYFINIIIIVSILSLFHQYYHYFINIIIILSILSFFYQYYHSFINIIIISSILSLFYHYFIIIIIFYHYDGQILNFEFCEHPSVGSIPVVALPSLAKFKIQPRRRPNSEFWVLRAPIRRVDSVVASPSLSISYHQIIIISSSYHHHIIPY